MNEWVAAAFIGVSAVVLTFGFAWMRGVSPRRLVWQDLSRVRVPNGAERDLVRSHVAKSLRIYGPVLIGALLLSGYLIAVQGEPLGLAVLICFGVPALLAVVRAVRVMRFLNSL